MENVLSFVWLAATIQAGFAFARLDQIAQQIYRQESESCLFHWHPSQYHTPDIGEGRHQVLTPPNVSEMIVKNVVCYVLEARPLENVLEGMQVLRVKNKLLITHVEGSNDTEYWSWREKLEEATFNFDFATYGINGIVLLKKKYVLRFESLHKVNDLSDTFSVLKIGHVNFPPYNYVDGSKVYGIDIDICILIASKLGVPYKLVRAPHIGLLPNMARQGAVDVTGFEVIFHPLWRAGNSLSPATYFRTFMLATQQPQPVDKYYTILKPLTLEVWVAIAATLLCLLITLKFTQTAYQDKYDSFELLIIAIGVMVNETIPHRFLILNLERKTMVLLLLVWIPMSCLLSFAYQSNLLSSLVKSRSSRPIDTFQDILDRHLTMYISKGNIIETLVEGSPFEIVQEVKEKHIEYYFFDQGKIPEEIWSEVVEGRAVVDLTAPRMLGRRHQIRKGRDLVLGALPAGFYYGLNNPFQEKCDEILSNIIDSGIFQKINEKYFWLESRPERDFYRNATSLRGAGTVLGHRHVLPLWMLLLASLALAVVVFGLEFFGTKVLQGEYLIA